MAGGFDEKAGGGAQMGVMQGPMVSKCSDPCSITHLKCFTLLRVNLDLLLPLIVSSKLDREKHGSGRKQELCIRRQMSFEIPGTTDQILEARMAVLVPFV